jgi:DNA-binding transcriptional ArsR family regulator
MTLEPAVLRAVANPRRQAILRLVWEREAAAGEIHAAMPDVSFGAVSQQLRTLAHAGLVEARREGQFRYYRARREAVGPMAAALERMWDSALWRLKLQAELEHARRGPRPGTRRRARGWRPRTQRKPQER